MPRARVVVLHQVGYRGGASTMLANMIRAVDKRAYEIIVVCPAGNAVSEFRQLGAQVIEAPRPVPQFPHYTGCSYWFGDPRFLRAAFDLFASSRFWRGYLRELRPDLIQLDAMTLAPLLPACRASGARVLCVVQETAVRGLLGVRFMWLRRLLSEMDGVMFISEYDRDVAGCKAPVVAVVPNWVDVPATRNSFDRCVESKKRLGLPLHSRVVLMMGGISALKGTLTLVDAAAELKDIKELLVCIAGASEPPPTSSSVFGAFRGALSAARMYHRKVHRSIRNNGLSRHVRFIGVHADVAPLYLAADVVVFPASRPHQARPVLEAGAFGKPVVVSDFPNLAEAVTNEFNGLTFAPHKPRELARQLRRILCDPSFAQSLGERNREVTLTRFNATENGPRYTGLLDRLVGRATMGG